MKNSRAKRPRQSVRSAVKKRGRASYNVWSVWSPKTQRRWLIDRDLCEEHWLLLEADPEILSFQLGPGFSSGDLPLEGELAKVDAIVRYRSGLVEWRSVRYRTELRDDDPPAEADREKSGVSFSRRLITEEHLSRNGLLIENFRRVVAVQSRTAAFPPAEEQNIVAAHLREKHRVVLGDLVANLEARHAALMLSGAFALLTSGFALSDLDVARLSTRTQLWLRG